MARIGVFICWCGENIARNVDVEQAAADDRRRAGRRLLGRLQIHVLRSRPVADAAEDRRRAADRRGRGLLLAAHAPADFPQGGRDGRAESLSGRNGQHPRALLVGASRPAAGHRQGRRTDPHGGRQGAKQPCPEADRHSRHAAGAGDRRRRGGHPGRARHRRRRLSGRAGRTRALDRRQDGRPLRNLSHARLLAVHPHAADGRCRPASEHHAPHLFGGRDGRGLRRQLPGHDPQEGPLRRYGEMHRLRPVLERVPLEEERPARSTTGWATARRFTCRFRRPCPPGR